MSQPDSPLLQLLQRHYGDRWNIRRTEHLWIATLRKPDAEHAPTLVEPDLEEFVRQLEDPPASIGRSLLSGGWFQSRLHALADGIYRSEEPPSA
ncbi:hypothetical protein LG943_10420 [Streptomonospora sp. S1-112]|uniref:Uncharacterized protein n=1 Tax=Streptomonospora mangrovi TaxID=2883123 RepID=A0A9X3NJ16_9ACTN|nr:hypothetical protein [Streptomonospora mangrovi]MDA0564739.1 hypothetical protein [Streptomonospora mangrovi]